jgi:predicted dehydrogenase
MKPKICVVGAGYWGKNLVRALYEIGCLYGVCDVDLKKLEKLRTEYDFKIFTSVKDALKDEEIEGYVIAVPPSSLDRVAIEVLKSGRHAFVEKPLSLSLKGLERMIEAAEKKGVILMGGYILIYNEALLFIKNWFNSEKPYTYYIYSQRLNLGIIRDDVNVWWSLAPHDISIINFLFNERPDSIRTFGSSFIRKGIEDVVVGEVSYPDGMKVYIHVSWIDPCKIRRTVFITNKGMIEFDDTRTDDKVRIHKKTVEKKEVEKGLGEFSSFAEFQVILRSGETLIPAIRMKEPLRVEMEHFVDCILKMKKPNTDGVFSYEVLKVIEAGGRSLKSERKVKINWER